jgi:Prokaryotic membrane lipoprotein lipid attachment site
MKRVIIPALAAFILSACAFAPAPGTPEPEVRKAMGAPAMEYDLPDGSRQLVFPRGPLGTETYMVYVKGGAVQRTEQVLTDDTFYRIQTGTTTQDDLRRMIGPPYRMVRFDNLRQVAWDYRFRDTWGYFADFSAMVDERGMVVGKHITRFNASRDGGSMGR